MVTCYIGLGSNLGDRRQNIQSSIEKIGAIPDTEVAKVSSFIETLPVGGPAQNNFLNAVIEIKTSLPAQSLLKELQAIESDLGRVRTVKDGPRTIDLDILFYDEKEVKEENLIIPHPRIREREFVLGPLREIAPHIVRRYEDNQKD